MYRPLEIDGRKKEAEYQVGVLAGKILAASSLDKGQESELLSNDMRLTTSEAICVMKACRRILQAKERNEKVFISGDYDADGITSTAIMKATLDALHIPNGYYIPDRFKEGYGLKPDIVDMVHARGYQLIITVDNGVKAHAALRRARELHIDTIVTDHHIIDEEVESDIVVHPQYMEEQYAYFSGAGVALEISRNLIGSRSDLNALAGVAAIGDVMPLWRETRKLVLTAIDQLKQGRPASLAALIYPGSYIDESTIAYSIVPKLNALSRMSDMANVNTAVPYLLSANPHQIHHYAAQLNQINDMRKQLSAAEIRKARTKINDDPFQIIYDPSYHVGICGITAGKICEEIHRPVLVLTDYEDVIKGSGRSVRGFDIFSFLSGISYKTEFGGHEMACGISVRKDKFSSFCEEIRQKIRTENFTITEETRPSVLISPDDVTFDNIIDLERLAPFPKEVMQPEFTIRHPVITKVDHTASSTRYHIQNASGGFTASIFAAKGISAPLHPEELTGRLTLHRYRGRISCQMMVDEAK